MFITSSNYVILQPCNNAFDEDSCINFHDSQSTSRKSYFFALIGFCTSVLAAIELSIFLLIIDFELEKGLNL